MESKNYYVMKNLPVANCIEHVSLYKARGLTQRDRENGKEVGRRAVSSF